MTPRERKRTGAPACCLRSVSNAAGGNPNRSYKTEFSILGARKSKLVGAEPTEVPVYTEPEGSVRVSPPGFAEC